MLKRWIVAPCAVCRRRARKTSSCREKALYQAVFGLRTAWEAVLGGSGEPERGARGLDLGRRLEVMARRLVGIIDKVYKVPHDVMDKMKRRMK